mgnify:CR=1 FL=1
MGELFLAEGTIKDSIVVVKQLAPALSADPDYLNMFKDEVRLASLFTHPNLVKSLAADTERKVAPADDENYTEVWVLAGESWKRK